MHRQMHAIIYCTTIRVKVDTCKEMWGIWPALSNLTNFNVFPLKSTLNPPLWVQVSWDQNKAVLLLFVCCCCFKQHILGIWDQNQDRITLSNPRILSFPVNNLFDQKSRFYTIHYQKFGQLFFSSLLSRHWGSQRQTEKADKSVETKTSACHLIFSVTDGVWKQWLLLLEKWYVDQPFCAFIVPVIFLNS